MSMATPETMTKRRFLTHPCATVAYAMRVMFFVLCALQPKKVYSNLRFSIFGATPPSGQGTAKSVEITVFLLFCGPPLKRMKIGGCYTLATVYMKVHAKYKEPTRPWAQGHSLQK